MPAATQPIALVDEGLSNSSYVVDLGDGRALVVDPGRDPGPYTAAARRQGLTVVYAAETHLHADLVSGSRELAAHGARSLSLRPAGPSSPSRARRRR
ncbi:MAG: MBL fold metallo-hydrolase [Streptosporangiaceae bacterium]